jgi:hypothetical protein
LLSLAFEYFPADWDIEGMFYFFLLSLTIFYSYRTMPAAASHLSTPFYVSWLSASKIWRLIWVKLNTNWSLSAKSVEMLFAHSSLPFPSRWSLTVVFFWVGRGANPVKWNCSNTVYLIQNNIELIIDHLQSRYGN